MFRHAVLCGSAPEHFQQKRLIDFHTFLTTKEASFLEKDITLFPNGVHELYLESVLNGLLDAASQEEERSEILLYFCALNEADLHAQLSDSQCDGIEVVRLEKNEIRKEVIAYYKDLSKKLDVDFSVLYESDNQFVHETSLGYEKVRF